MRRPDAHVPRGEHRPVPGLGAPHGEPVAGDLARRDTARPGDREVQLKLILGSLLGDGSLRFASHHNAAFRVGHGERQREYCQWKHEMLAPFAHEIGRTGNGIGFDTIPMNQLAWLRDAVYAGSGGRTVSDELISQLDERAIAARYCDDGSFSGHYKRWGYGKSVIYCKALSADDKERLAVRCEELGMGRPTVRERELLFSGERTRKFQEKIAPYVHPSLAYKLHPDMRGQFSGIRIRATPI
jgi:recombination protein RecA